MVDIEQVKKDSQTANTTINGLIKEIVKAFEEKHNGVTLDVSANVLNPNDCSA